MFSLNGTLKKSGSFRRWETKQFTGMALADLCESVTPPAQDTNPLHVNLQQKLILIYTAELTGANQTK